MTTTSAVSTAIGKTVVEFLRRKVDEHGDRDALLFKPGFRYLRWSYRRIWRESGQVATLLQRRGIGKGDRVVLWGPNCPQWVLAFFGCLRAGVVVVPLDLRSAPDYVERVLSRTDPKLAFTSRFTPKEGVALDAPELTFEDLETVIHDLPDPEPVEVGADDLAEVMFTSGTTGDPKGVMLTHRNLTANIEGITEYVNVDPSSRLLSILPLSHMYEQMGGLFVVIYFGANVTYPTSRQPTVLARTMRERRTTVMLLVPQALDLLMSGIEREVRRKGKEGLWKMLLSVAERTPFRLRRRLFGTVHKQFGGKLDFIVSGGAALDPDLGRKWELLGVKIVQGYGATEASPVISNHTTEVHPLDSVGRPLPNVEVRIDDAGEILVRGESVTPGYWEAPEVTADSFEGDWYKTGDLGFFDDQGFLHIQGRVKDMIVLPSGQNVYPDDVQAVLNRHPAVVDSTVVGLPDGPAEEVHAALILDDSAEEPASGDEVVSWANERLAEQQRVRGFTIWPEEDFPRTHTLKVKKPLVIERLMESPGQQQPPAAAPSSNGASQPGVRGLEHIVAEVAQRSPAEVRPEMALGEDLDIDSLGRVELLSAVEAELGVYLDESGVTPETTVADLAGLIERAAASPPVTKFPKWGMRWWCRMAPGRHPARLRLPRPAPHIQPDRHRRPQAPGRHRPRHLRLEPQPGTGQPPHHQGRPPGVAPPPGHRRGGPPVAQPHPMGRQPPHRQRLPPGQGRRRPAQPGEHGQDRRRRLVHPHLPRGPADLVRPHQALHERHRPGGRGGPAARRAHASPYPPPRQALVVPAAAPRLRRDPLRRPHPLPPRRRLHRRHPGHRKRRPRPVGVGPVRSGGADAVVAAHR